ncbi:MAG: YfhO family protein, partial [Lachnospiraceae bacterium]|nr:YfhO family protein [Lachnospiraceae bacterium]
YMPNEKIDKIKEYSDTSYDAPFDQYEIIDANKSDTLYKNNYIVNPIVVSETDLEDYQAAFNLDTTNIYANVSETSNALAKGLTSVDNILVSSDADIEIVDSKNCNAVIYEGHIVLEQTDNYDPSKPSSVIYKLSTDADGDYYICDNKFAHIGRIKAGEYKNVKIEVEPGMFNAQYGMYSFEAKLYRLDENAFVTLYDKLKSNEMDIESYTDSSITGTINSKGDHLVFTTIPYDKGWNIYIDDEKVKTESISGAFLAFHVPGGEHKVYMEYKVIGLSAGIIVSLLFLALGIFMMLYYRKNRDCIFLK